MLNGMQGERCVVNAHSRGKGTAISLAKRESRWLKTSCKSHRKCYCKTPHTVLT